MGNREVLRCCWCRCEKQIAGLSAAFFRVATATASTTQPVPASLTHAPLALNEDLTRVRTMASHENRNEVQVEAPAISQEPAKPSLSAQEIEKQEEDKLKSRYNARPMTGHSAFLAKRLAKGQKYFDSGDYQMAKQQKAVPPSTAKVAAAVTPSVPLLGQSTGAAIPTPDSVPTQDVHHSIQVGHSSHVDSSFGAAATLRTATSNWELRFFCRIFSCPSLPFLCFTFFFRAVIFLSFSLFPSRRFVVWMYRAPLQHHRTNHTPCPLS